jgi:hypothetical protein
LLSRSTTLPLYAGFVCATSTSLLEAHSALQCCIPALLPLWPQVPTCEGACIEALEGVGLGTVSTAHEALLLLRSLPAHLGDQLRGFEQRFPAALAELARACPADALLAPLLLLVFGDVPATLGQEGALRAVVALPSPAVLQLASSDGLHVTSENDVLVGQLTGRNGGVGRGVGRGEQQVYGRCGEEIGGEEIHARDRPPS